MHIFPKQINVYANYTWVRAKYKQLQSLECMHVYKIIGCFHFLLSVLISYHSSFMLIMINTSTNIPFPTHVPSILYLICYASSFFVFMRKIELADHDNNHNSWIIILNWICIVYNTKCRWWGWLRFDWMIVISGGATATYNIS